jgi:ribose/xylose/arabinose/galactoside ABC-type transport system permease subunit
MEASKLMRQIGRLLNRPTARPYLLLIAIVVLLVIADNGQGRVLSTSTVYSMLQQFATFGPVALALGLTMMIREFDISVAGTFGLASCVAVITGETSPLLGLVLAVLVGGIGGAIQGGIMVRLGLSSIGVTLGGLLTLGGLAYVVTGNQTIAFSHLDVATAVNARLFGILSVRSLVAIILFAIAAVFVSWTRIGRDLLSAGSDRRAARIAGVRVERIVIGVFAVSGMLTAITGSLLSYSLAAASPIALADILVPAVAAAIMGGVSLSGGKGRPAGIAGGVLILAVLRSGLTAIGVPPYVHNIVTAGVLLIVAILDSDDLQRRLHGLKSAFGANRQNAG